jgi:hypothetical protein
VGPKFGKRVFDVHENAVFTALDDAIAKTFNREPGSHMSDFRYPLPSHVLKPEGLKKRDLEDLCGGCGRDGNRWIETARVESGAKANRETTRH